MVMRDGQVTEDGKARMVLTPVLTPAGVTSLAEMAIWCAPAGAVTITGWSCAISAPEFGDPRA
jgi:hypothetical protein